MHFGDLVCLLPMLSKVLYSIIFNFFSYRFFSYHFFSYHFRLKSEIELGSCVLKTNKEIIHTKGYAVTNSKLVIGWAYFSFIKMDIRYILSFFAFYFPILILIILDSIIGKMNWNHLQILEVFFLLF